ncbi:redoxin family protein [Neolewinella lacunae]|uniref:redoxin family protein n=1 Tax=Neolewinella lacunae TaxID=1517758 RepID=UPI001CA42FC4|nr:redoxin family protein [Neolewinella lacunae]
MRYLLCSLALLLTGLLTAQESYRITVKIDGYDQEVLSLANNLLDKQFVVDTAYRADDGSYVFASDTSALPRGIYLVVLAPDNNYFQMVVGNDDDQVFSLHTRMEELSSVKVGSSLENERFFSYLDFLNKMQEESLEYQNILKDSTSTAVAKEKATAMMERFDQKVTAFQDGILEKYPESFVAAIIKTNRPFPPPAFEDIQDPDARSMAQLRWLQAHYLDPIPLQDDRILRTPFLFSRLNYYVDRLFVQDPDTVSMAIDRVLERMDPKSELFKHYVVHFINKAAGSKFVGMDAVYVHMVDKYYASGLATWADPDQVASMMENADKTRPLLIGKSAPNLTMTRRDGSPVELYDVKANYTVLYFWQFSCPSCKKSTPYMKDFYAKWKDKGVEIFAICTRQTELGKCWEYVDENEIGEWLHATDRYQRFHLEYNVQSTPSIYVLDENKKIVSKRIGAEQLDEVLTALEAQKASSRSGKK